MGGTAVGKGGSAVDEDSTAVVDVGEGAVVGVGTAASTEGEGVIVAATVVGNNVGVAGSGTTVTGTGSAAGTDVSLGKWVAVGAEDDESSRIGSQAVKNRIKKNSAKRPRRE